VNDDVVTTAALHYTVDGPADAPVLLLGPSLGTTTELWAPQVPALAARFRVVRYDHRGHGRSPVPPAPYTLAELGGDVLAVLDTLGVGRAHVAGLSLGGMVSMWLAANAPDRVDRLVVVCSSARLGPPDMWADRAAAVRAGGLERIADAVIGRWFPPDFGHRAPEVVAAFRAMLTSTPAEGYAACCGVIETMDLEPDLPRITAATLVVAGLADGATPPAHARRIADAVPGARLALIAGAAHLANVARPELVTQLLVDFLNEPAAEEVP
jgi:3-oxoadipate enol-lactonase